MDYVFESWAQEKAHRIQQLLMILIVNEFLLWIGFIVATIYGEMISTPLWIRFSIWPITYWINKSLHRSRMLLFAMIISFEIIMFDLLAQDKLEIIMLIPIFQGSHILKNFIANGPIENIFVILLHHVMYIFGLWYHGYL